MANLRNPLPDAPIGYSKGPDGRRVPVTLDTDAWDPYFRSLEQVVQSAPERLKSVYRPAEAAAIGTTSVPMPSLATGIYRVTFTIQQTVVATASLDLQVTIGWTRGAVSQTKVGTLLNTNTLTTYESVTVMVRVDQGTPITYAVSYVSVGATPGQFDFDIVVEAMPA